MTHNRTQERKRVAVGMSGGVDSAVSAALLKDAGMDVFGVFIKTWQPDFLPCTWREERQDAMRVCARLGIPFRTIDLSKEYKQDIVDYMVGEYSTGRTPNPDVMCNKHIKFGAFFNWALQNGADMIATGHYARIRNPSSAEALAGKHELEIRNQVHKLLAGVDAEKDQSYFLWTLTQDVQQKTLFPIGEYTKGKVRALARKFELHNADKKDSQGVCFLGEIDMREFLKHYIKIDAGAVLNESGNVIGAHEGSLFYTIGQRHGFAVTKKTPESGAFYVVAKDVAANTITASEHFREPGKFETAGVVLEDVNWIASVPEAGREYKCRFRYRQPLQHCRVEEIQMSNAKVIFHESQKAVATGQSIVVYNGDECLGGGVIASTL